MKYYRKTMNPFLFLLTCVLLLSGCHKVKLTGTIITKELPARPFTEICVGDDITVIMTDSVSSIVVTTDAALQTYLVTQVSDKEFKAYYKGNPYFSEQVTTIYLPFSERIDEVDLSGDAAFYSSATFSVKEFELSLSGSSYFRGQVEADDFDIDMSGTSTADVEGFANDLELEMSGSSLLRCSKQFGVNGLAANCCSGDLYDNSEAHVHCEKAIYTNTSGNSALFYTGNPVVWGSSTGTSGIYREN